MMLYSAMHCTIVVLIAYKDIICTQHIIAVISILIAKYSVTYTRRQQLILTGMNYMCIQRVYCRIV